MGSPAFKLARFYPIVPDIGWVARIVPLGEVDDFEIAEGYSDVRGWRVDAADGTEIGKVHELLVDIDAMRTRYLDVRLTTDVANAPLLGTQISTLIFPLIPTAAWPWSTTPSKGIPRI